MWSRSNNHLPFYRHSRFLTVGLVLIGVCLFSLLGNIVGLTVCHLPGELIFIEYHCRHMRNEDISKMVAIDVMIVALLLSDSRKKLTTIGLLSALFCFLFLS